MAGKRIVVLGVGGAGSECVRDMVVAQDISEILLADVDVGKCEALRSALGDPRVTTAAIDISDVEGAAKILTGYDAVLSALYEEHFASAFEAACRAKVNYTDLYSHATEAIRRRAKDAGIAAIPNLGASPGISNVLGKKGCELFDEPIEAHFSHVNLRFIAPTQGALDFAVAYAGRPDHASTCYFKDGAFVQSPPLDGAKQVDFGEPLGEFTTYIMPHSQAETFPRHFPTLRYAVARGTWKPETMSELRALRRCGVLDDTEAVVGDKRVNVRRFMRDHIWAARGGEPQTHFNGFGLHIEVGGWKDGKYGRATYRVAHDPDWASATRMPVMRMTGIGASIGTLLFTRRGRTFTGIVEAEAYFDAKEFLDELTSRQGIRFSETVDWNAQPLA